MDSSSRILIVDDTQSNITLLTRILNLVGYSCIESAVGKAALKRVASFAPDLIILDLMMSGMDGYAFLQGLSQVVPVDAFLPVLVVTADSNIEARRRALSLGATDFMLRPHEIFDVTLRVQNLLATRALHCQVMANNHELETQLRAQTRHLEESQAALEQEQRDVVARLAMLGERRDDQTGKHTRRVAHISHLIAQQMGLSPEEAESIHRAAPLHDVGKIAIPDSVLLKPGRLTPEEFATIKTHCEIGGKMLSNGRSKMLQNARAITLSHHERWDGKGYPFGLSGEAIPLAGRIVAVADVFDALTHERPYKHAWTVGETVEEICRQSGSQFAPDVVTAFCQLDHTPLIHAPH